VRSINKIGEVIEASTDEFVAECYELHQAPPLGSLVKTGDRPTEIYGVVYNAATSSIEPGRRPIARGKEEVEEEDIYRANPQLLRLLRTDFKALVLGHREGEKLHHYLPPRPARIHSFVYLCDPDEVREFSQSLDFLSVLVTARVQGAIDEMVAAFLRQASQAHPDRRGFLVAAGKQLVTLLSGEFTRLDTILRRIRE
jgi:hypothetical protein